MTQDFDDYVDEYDRYYHDEFDKGNYNNKYSESNYYDDEDDSDYNFYHYDKDTRVNKKKKYEDDIIEELEEGNSYTARQLTIYAISHPDVIIIHNKISNFDLSSNKSFKITQKFNGYIHFGKEGMYYHPCFQNVICIIE